MYLRRLSAEYRPTLNSAEKQRKRGQFAKRKIEFSNKSWPEVTVEGGPSVGKVAAACRPSIG